MDLSLESISLPPWDPVRAEEWNDAYEKVENYLRACRVSSHLQRARLIALVLQRVYDRKQSDPSVAETSLPELAIVEVRERVTEWIRHYLPPHADGSALNLGEGMLAIYLCDGPTRWPYAFLDSHRMPAEYAEALSARVVRAGPDLAVSSMVPREMDLGLMPGLVGSAMESFEALPVLKTLAAWLLFLGVLGFLFWYTR
ncbi:MAG TPA: hypothetical protein PKM57_10100 [Kiritimatiellia bacterium]|nr:hypothetical protein [Kiritimatiellia bacterium]HPS08865.1 hypothetical protein [Kiritimatiellia bacterium]